MKIGRIAIIGAGNMGGAIARGIVKSGYLPASAIAVSDPSDAKRAVLSDLGIQVYKENVDVVAGADLVLFAVKPYHIQAVIDKIVDQLTPQQMLVSIVAGVSLSELAEFAGSDKKIFRVMPNTAISILESMTCIAGNGNTTDDLDAVTELFDQLGKTAIIPEELMAAATVLASCGTAFALRYVRAAMQGGVEMGFGAEMAQFITAQTVKGAVELIMDTGNHPEREIDKVTTPRGITITGINEMEHKGFSSSLIQGLIASFNKIVQA